MFWSGWKVRTASTGNVRDVSLARESLDDRLPSHREKFLIACLWSFSLSTTSPQVPVSDSYIVEAQFGQTVAQVLSVANRGSEGGGEGDGQKRVQRCVTTGYPAGGYQDQSCHQYCE